MIPTSQNRCQRKGVFISHGEHKTNEDVGSMRGSKSWLTPNFFWQLTNDVLFYLMSTWQPGQKCSPSFFCCVVVVRDENGGGDTLTAPFNLPTARYGTKGRTINRLVPIHRLSLALKTRWEVEAVMLVSTIGCLVVGVGILRWIRT